MSKKIVAPNNGAFSKMALPLLAVLISLTAGFGGGWLGARSYDKTGGTGMYEAGQQIALNQGQLINEISNQVGPSVVSIDVIGSARQQSIFGFTQEFQTASAGTGVIISEQGDIITNRHVVPRGTDQVIVTLSDGTRFEDVEVVGRTPDDDSLDIAFLKIKDLNDAKLQPATLGDSSATVVGELAVAIGNALGQFENSVTSGIISGFGRSVMAATDSMSSESLQNLIQTDAAINSGNSGGPLVNARGEVIGINTAIAGGQAQNIGFAIPINDIKSLIASVLETGELQRPYLGVRYVMLDDGYAETFDITENSGAYVVPSGQGNSSILNDSPASKANLREGDIIKKVGDIQLDERNTLASVISRYRVGETVTLEIVRDGETVTQEVTLEPRE